MLKTQIWKNVPQHRISFISRLANIVMCIMYLRQSVLEMTDSREQIYTYKNQYFLLSQNL